MAKSPFADVEVRTYNYPAPLDHALSEEDVKDPLVRTREQERLSGLIDPEEEGEGHWIKIRVPRSKADVDAVADATQSMVTVDERAKETRVEQRIGQGNRDVFELLVEEWSFTSGKPSGDDFARLDTWSGDWVSAALGDAVRRGTSRDYAKKTKPSSPKPNSSRSKRTGTPAAQ